MSLNSVGMFIFGGSATFGVEAAGYKVDQILELTDNMTELNAYHFAKNRPDVPIILPKEWEEDKTYNVKLQAKNFDLLYANCPCSSLSKLNRNAAVDGKNNVHFYRVFNAIKDVRPKAFLIENAPTLIYMGYPILLDMFNQLGDLYKFTIIRDEAGNHNVAMRRQRTLLVGWRKDFFKDEIPLIHMNLQQKTSQKDIIGDLYDIPVGSQDVPNHDFVPGREWEGYDHLLAHVKTGETLLDALIRDWDNLKVHFPQDSVYYRQVERAKAKREAGGRIWNKAPERKHEDELAPSISSVAHYAHPIHDRQYTIREYARLMGYPDSFVFHDGSKAPIVQTIAQGVPARFIEYIASEIGEAIKGNREMVPSSGIKNVVFQHHTHKVAKAYDMQELLQQKLFDYDGKDKSFFKLIK